MPFGAHRPLNKIATAIGAGIAEAVFGAIGAKGAFKRAYPGIGRRRGKVLVAALAIRLEHQHVRSP